MTTLALIGVGKWGKNYLSTAKNLPDIKIKYICARNTSTLDQFPDDYTKVTSVSELLKNKDIDGAIVATPPDSHFEIVKELMAADINILIEKPLTLDLRQAEQLDILSKGSRSKIMVGHIFLFNPAYQAAKVLLPQVGPLKEIIFEGLGTATRDYSVIWDWGPHPIAICLDLLNEMPGKYSIEVLERSSINLVSDAKIDLEFNSGAQARIRINCQSDPRVRSLQLVGSKGAIILDDTNQDSQKLTLSIDGEVSHPEYDSLSPLTVELKHFAQFITQDVRPPSDLDFGIQVVRILTQISDLSSS